MATIDLTVLGVLKEETLNVCDIQELMEYCNIPRWVKVSTPPIYEKVIQPEEKGYIKSSLAREGKMLERTIYSLIETDGKESEHLMHETTSQPIRIFLGFSVMIVNLSQLLSGDKQSYLQNTEGNVKVLKSSLEENIREKEQDADVPETGITALR